MVFCFAYESQNLPDACFTGDGPDDHGTFAFDGGCSVTPEGTGPLTFAWDFGDGATADGARCQHAFEPGRHLVALRVANGLGLSGRTTRYVSVSCAPGDVAPWIAADVGTPLFAGSSSRDSSRFTLCAGGEGLTGDRDELHFVHSAANGGFELTARLSRLSGGNTSAGAGLMARTGLGGADVFVGVFVERTTAVGGTRTIRCRWRSESGGAAFSTRLGTVDGGDATPLWLRLRRQDDVVAIFVSESPEGVFPEVPTIQKPLHGPALAGVAGFGRDSGAGAASFEALAATFEEVALTEVPPSSARPFIRGDANADAAVDISDGVYSLGYLFLGGAAPTCVDAGDADDSGDLVITDPIYVLNHLFLGGPAPPSPFGDCGTDSTEDHLGCESFLPCP